MGDLGDGQRGIDFADGFFGKRYEFAFDQVPGGVGCGLQHRDIDDERVVECSVLSPA